MEISKTISCLSNSGKMFYYLLWCIASVKYTVVTHCSLIITSSHHHCNILIMPPLFFRSIHTLILSREAVYNDREHDWQQPTNHVTLSSHHLAILSSYHLSSYHHATLILPPSYHSILLPSCHSILLPSCHSNLLPSCHLPSCHSILLPSCHFNLLPSCHSNLLSSILLPSCHSNLLLSCHSIHPPIVLLVFCYLCTCCCTCIKCLLNMFLNHIHMYSLTRPRLCTQPCKQISGVEEYGICTFLLKSVATR